MRAAFCLAKQALSDYSSRFPRHDFTLPQLFASLELALILGHSAAGLLLSARRIRVGSL